MKLPFINSWKPPDLLARLPTRLPPLSAPEARILEALADTVFPADAGLPISGGEAHVVAYFEDLLSRLPLREQVLLRGMLWGFQAQALLTRPRALSLFTGLGEADREASLKAWDESPLYPARLLFQALRGILLWAYVDNAEVGEAMGISPSDELRRSTSRAGRQEDPEAVTRTTDPVTGSDALDDEDQAPEREDPSCASTS